MPTERSTAATTVGTYLATTTNVPVMQAETSAIIFSTMPSGTSQLWPSGTAGIGGPAPRQLRSSYGIESHIGITLAAASIAKVSIQICSEEFDRTMAQIYLADK